MALPTSGPLSMSAIATEFSQGTSNLSLYTFGSTLPTPTVTSNIELANDFYGQSAVTLTSFSYNVATYKFVGGGPSDNFMRVDPAGVVYVTGRCR